MQQYQVNELTALLKGLIEHAFQGLIMVHGEVSGVSGASSGHIYFTLKDEGAKLKAAYFKQHIRRDSFIPKNGDKVSAIGELRLYEPDGTYSLIVRKVVYNAEGEFWRKFEETKRRLEARGLFDAASKRDIPLYPRRIALLTASSGAAVKDFIVTARNAGCFFYIDVWPIPVQGKDTAPLIVSAIEKAGKRTDLYDVLVLSRGGGSLDDLAVFNEESIAVALKNSRVPTISAIGHEQDVSICDMVADLRVATPTAAGAKLTSAYKEATVRAARSHSALLRLLRLRLENANLGLDKIEARLHAAGAVASLERYRLRLTGARQSLIASIKAKTAEYRHKLESLKSRVTAASPDRKITELRGSLNAAQLAIVNSAAKQLTEYNHKLQIQSQRLELTDPERLLSRGYALVTVNGTVLTTVQNVHLEDEIDIKIKDGRLSAFVTAKKANK